MPKINQNFIILACRHGGWSHINHHFFKALRAEFTDLEWHEMDYQKEVLEAHPGWRILFLMIAAMVYQRRLRALINKPGQFYYEWQDAALLTSFAFRKGHVLAQRRLRYLQGTQKTSFVIQTGSRYSARIPGVPHFIYTDHTHLTNLQYPVFQTRQLNDSKWLKEERQMYQDATRIFTLSEHVRKSLQEDYDIADNRCVKVGAGFNASPPSDWNGVRDWSRKEILFIGTQWERKGGPALLRAFEQVRQHHPEARLLVVGCSPRINMPHVEVIGFLPLEQVNHYLAEATVFCLPTRQEPFGIVFLEAMSFGLPVVATSIGALPELVDHERTGLLVADQDVEGLAQALSNLLSDSERLTRYSYASREKVLEYYRWDLVAKRVRDAIREASIEIAH